MHTQTNRAGLGLFAFLALLPLSYAQESVVLDARVNVLQLDSANAIGLSSSGPNLTIDATGNPRFGSPPSAQYKSVVYQFLRDVGGIDYRAIPLNAPPVAYSGPGNAFLTDGEGTLGDNVGQADLTVRDAALNPVEFRTLFANMAAEHNATTVIPFLTSGSLGLYEVCVSGVAWHGAPDSAVYWSAVLQFQTEDGGLDYAVAPAHQCTTVYGKDVRIFITDATGTLGDNRGFLTAMLTPVPDPATGFVLCAGMACYWIGRRARIKRTR